MVSGTTTPGTSFFINSAFLKLASGHTPAIIGISYSEILSRNLNNESGSNTGCVIINSAPASIFSLVLRISRSKSIALGSAPTEISTSVFLGRALPPKSIPLTSMSTCHIVDLSHHSLKLCIIEGDYIHIDYGCSRLV